MSINYDDLEISTYRTDGGSAWAPKYEHAVRIVHRPSGIIVTSSTERSQHANKEAAIRELERLVAALPRQAEEGPMKIAFVNGKPAKCGCAVEYSSGGGEYSDVIYVTPCAKHSGSATLDLVAVNRIALTPEYEGQWHADLYLDREVPLAKAEGKTPSEAVLAVLAAERTEPEQAEGAQGEREAFEAWLHTFDFPPRLEGEIFDDERYPEADCFGQFVYDDHSTQRCWAAWQARAALAQPSTSVVRDDDLVPVPRGLLGSAMFAIRNQVEAPNTLAKLREYAYSRVQPSPAPERSMLSDPEAVLVNMMRGAIAKPSIRGMAKLYGPVINGEDAIQFELMKVRAERDAAQARVAELEKQEPVGVIRASSELGVAPYADIWPWLEPGTQLYAAPVAQAGQAPQAWLDVQAERRRQVADEGWTPEHDNEHDHGQMARAAACYALAGSSAADDKTTALLVSLAWPWDQQWWKPTTARRDLVKACALALAEIERLDRAAAPQPAGGE